MLNKLRQYTYTPTQFGYSGSYGIDSFHFWLMEHPKCARFPSRVWDILFQGFRLAEAVHNEDMRKNDKRPYINHQIEMILEYLEKYETRAIFSDDILALMLHDIIEDHPECWRMVLDTFGYRVFRDILVLSTGGIPLSVRAEILDFMLHKNEDSFPISEEKQLLASDSFIKSDVFSDIIRIVSPADPTFKQENKSFYKSGSPEFQKIRNAIKLYKKEIIMRKNGIVESDVYKNDEYLGLGNYLYFTPVDAKRKLQDMIHNMSDMQTMESKKPGYIATRRIKAYILGVKLRNFGMHEEYARLQQAFQNTDTQILTDSEVIIKLRKLP